MGFRTAAREADLNARGPLRNAAQQVVAPGLKDPNWQCGSAMSARLGGRAAARECRRSEIASCSPRPPGRTSILAQRCRDRGQAPKSVTGAMQDAAAVRSAEFDSLLLKRAVAEVQRRCHTVKSPHDPDVPPETFTRRFESRSLVNCEAPATSGEMERLLGLCTSRLR